MRADLQILYPSLRARRQEAVYQVDRTERILILLLAGIILAGILHLQALRAGILEAGSLVRREPAGGGGMSITVAARPAETAGSTDSGMAEGGALEGSAEGETEMGAGGGSTRPVQGEKGGSGKAGAEADREGEGEEASAARDYGTYMVTVHARQFSRLEAKKRAGEILQLYPQSLLGENASAEEIRSPLRMPDASSVEPFALHWESNRYSVLDTDGSLSNEDYCNDQAEAVELTAILEYADYRFEKTMAFTVRAPFRDEAALFREAVSEALRDAEEESRTEESFRLPNEVGGRKLAWEERVEDISASVLVLALVACMLAWYVADYRLHERTRERNRQLALDYPQLVSKIVLYMGAGMSVRNVFYKCASDYPGKRGQEKPRYLYEEILLVCNELDSGIPEAEAYMHFGRRCHCRQYTKLCSLLVQNLRKGNDALLGTLQEEAKSSFEERKNLARELGEEAGTKLLFPMMIMLGVTMLIIIVPAYFGFSM